MKHDNTCKDRLCYLYIYLISDTCTIITQICHKVTQEEVCLHITISSSLSHSSMLQTADFSRSRLIHVDFAWKKRMRGVVAKLWSSISVNLVAHREDAYVRYQHCCGGSPTVLLCDALNVESAFHQQMSSSWPYSAQCRAAVHRPSGISW